MSKFAYACKNGHAQEFDLKKAPKRVACLECSQWATRVYSVPPAHFSGHGFTRTST